MITQNPGMRHFFELSVKRYIIINQRMSDSKGV